MDDPHLALELYRAVWWEFYAWATRDFDETIASLPHKNDQPPRNSNLTWLDSNDDSVDSTFTVTDFDENSEIVSIRDAPAAPSITISFASKLESLLPGKPKPTSEHFLDPFPRYDSCTPAAMNIFDRGDLTVLQFMPLADDPKFRHGKYIKPFALKWVRGLFSNPDVEIIQEETARRLHFMYGFSIEDINSTHLLQALKRSDSHGLAWDITQRDRPPVTWSISRDDLPNFRHVLKQEGLDESVDRGLRTLCPNPSCVVPFCSSHDCNSEYPPYIASKMLALSADFQEQEGDPECGEYCFKYLPDDSETLDTMAQSLTEAQENAVENIYNIMPDILPCYAPVPYFVTCRETFLARRKIFPDEKIAEKIYEEDPKPSERHFTHDYLPRNIHIALPEPSTRSPTPVREPDTLGQLDEDIKPLVPDDDDNLIPDIVPPCAHTGPCGDRNTICQCVAQKFCQRSCRCPHECEFRRIGCSCTPQIRKDRRSGKQTYIVCGENCPCQNSSPHRECDPELCHRPPSTTKTRSGRPRKAKGISSGLLHLHSSELPLELNFFDACCNASLQKGVVPNIVVGRAKYGQGAFAKQSIRSMDFIGEYISEIFSSHIDERRAVSARIHREYTNKNYMFDHTTETYLDAKRVGNLTRFFNHGETRIYDGQRGNEFANAYAAHYIVNDEVRIAIYASEDISAKREILLDYGTNFWTDRAPPTPPPPNAEIIQVDSDTD